MSSTKRKFKKNRFKSIFNPETKKLDSYKKVNKGWEDMVSGAFYASSHLLALERNSEKWMDKEEERLSLESTPKDSLPPEVVEAMEVLDKNNG